MLEVKKLNKEVNDFSLEDITFSLEKGYIMGIIGPNGAGKSTLLKTIMGLRLPNSGIITIDGVQLSENEVLYKSSIGFVDDELKIEENLRIRDFKNRIKGYYKAFNYEKFKKLLVQFNLNEKQKIGNLSKGEKVKLMFANALSHNAKLILLDEPTAGLDPVARKEILKLLQQEIENGDKSIIFSTHITSDLDEIADYITLINNGRIVFTKDIEEIKDKYRIVRGNKEDLEKSHIKFINIKDKPYYSEGLFIVDDVEQDNSAIASLEEILYHHVKGSEVND